VTLRFAAVSSAKASQLSPYRAPDGDRQRDPEMAERRRPRGEAVQAHVLQSHRGLYTPVSAELRQIHATQLTMVHTGLTMAYCKMQIFMIQRKCRPVGR
jgi:hypothetical protein